MYALYMLIMIGNASVGWTQTVTYVGEYRDSVSCENAAKGSALVPPGNLPGNIMAPHFICIPKQP